MIPHLYYVYKKMVYLAIKSNFFVVFKINEAELVVTSSHEKDEFITTRKVLQQIEIFSSA